MNEKLYNILKIPYNSNIDKIKESYRKLMIEYHPDCFLDDITKLKMLSLINKAYYILIRKQKEYIYDETFIIWLESFYECFKFHFSKYSKNDINYVKIELLNNIFNEIINYEKQKIKNLTII